MILHFRLILFLPAFGLLLLATACEKAEESTLLNDAPESSISGDLPLPENGARPLTAEEQKGVVDQLIRARAQEQAQGLGSGGVTVNGAWNYEGYSFLSPDPNAAIEARLVAVDLTVTGHTKHFDIDDIEIVDGANLMSYGSDPHATPLTLDGEIMPEEQWPEEPPKANRWLLIYAYPKQSPAFHLYYWGKALTDEPIAFENSGPALPYPSNKSLQE